MSVRKEIKIVGRRQTVNARFFESGLPASVVLCSLEQLDRLIRKHDQGPTKVGLTRGREVCHHERPLTVVFNTAAEQNLHQRVWDDLEDKREQLRDSLLAGRKTKPPRQPTEGEVETVNDLVDLYLRASESRGLASETLKHQRHQLKHVREFAGERRLETIDRRSFDADFVRHLRTKGGAKGNGLSASYLFQIHRITHVWWNWSVQNEYVSFALIRQRVQRPAAESRPLSRGEVIEVLAHLPAEPLNTQRIVNLLRYTGVRRAELWNLRLEDIHLDPPSPQRPHCLLGTVKQTKTGGRGEVRTLDNPHLLEFLRKDIAERGTEEKWFLDDGSGNRAGSSSDCVTRVLRKFLRRLGIENRQPCHCFRHTAAIELLEGGIDLKTVADYLGHRNIQTTAGRYLSAERVQARVADAAALLN